jgi:glycosyltransferase involved in cell wall biosynthesis
MRRPRPVHQPGTPRSWPNPDEGSARPVRPVIAYLLPWPGFGGGEVATLRLAGAVAARDRFEPFAFCRPETAVEAQFRAASIPTVAYDPLTFSYRHGAPYVRGAWRLARELRRRQVDLVHASDLMGVYQAALAARLAGIPLVTHIRSNFPPADIPWHHKLPIAAVDHFVFVSRATQTHFNQIYRVPPRLGSVIYDWVPPMPATLSNKSPADVRAEFGIDADAPLIGMVARVAPQKDFETLLAAMTNVTAAFPRARLLIAGEYERPDACRAYWRQLCERVRATGLENHVTWAGFRSDVPELMRAMDVVVLATHTEGFGLAVLEGMNEQRPVVATRVGGVPEIVVDGDNGLLYERGDAVGLADAICRVLGDPAFAMELGRRGAVTARTRFTESNTVSAVTALYARMIGAVEPAARSKRVVEA